MRTARGFTLVELMIALVVAAVLLTLAAPSFYDFILVQRLKGINAQLVADLQFARSEALSRTDRQSGSTVANVDVQVAFPPLGATMSCYTIYTDTDAMPRHKCDCTKAAGQRCLAGVQEIRTVQIPAGNGVTLSALNNRTGMSFLAINGAMVAWPIDVAGEFSAEASIDSARKLRTTVGLSGRPSVCSPGGGVTGFPPC